MSQEQRTQQDAVWWVKEKQALENQLAEKEKEITTVKSRNYDLLKQVEELTQKLQVWFNHEANIMNKLDNWTGFVV